MFNPKKQSNMAKKPSLRPAVTPTRRGAAVIKRPLPIAKPNGIGETNAETKQKFSVKTEPKITTKIVKLSQRFSIYGNKDAVVKRVYGKNGGDGNLSTDHTRYVEVSGKPSFSYDGKKGTASFKVDFRFFAYEQDAGRKASRDGLEFTKSITVSEKVGVEREVIGLGARNSDNTYDAYKYVEVSVESFAPQRAYGEAFYKGKYGSGDKEGFRNIDAGDAQEANRHQDWMSIDDVRVQFDGDGSELFGTNHLAMKGCVTFYVNTIEGQIDSVIVWANEVAAVLAVGALAIHRIIRANTGGKRAVTVILADVFHGHQLPTGVERADHFAGVHRHGGGRLGCRR